MPNSILQDQLPEAVSCHFDLYFESYFRCVFVEAYEFGCVALGVDLVGVFWECDVAYGDVFASSLGVHVYEFAVPVLGGFSEDFFACEYLDLADGDLGYGAWFVFGSFFCYLPLAHSSFDSAPTAFV